MRLRVSILLVAAALVLGACTPYITPSGPAPLRFRDLVFSGVTTSTGVVYGIAPDQDGNLVELKLDVYEPTGDTASKRPAIVWVHGGGFSGGTRTSPEIVDEATAFARRGYVNVSISYRLMPGGCSAAGPTASCLTAIVNAQHDAQAAVRFLRKHAAAYRVDPTRIAIGGTSAGAITALNVGYNSDDPGTSGNAGYSSAVGAAVSLSGARLGGSASPGDAPALLFHGTADPLVPYQWAVNTVNDAHAAGLAAYLTTFQGEGHVPYQHRDQIIGETSNFLYWELDVAHIGG